MKILALEFSTARRSVAVLDAPMESAAKRCGLAEEVGGRGARAFALVEDALRQAGMEREQIECVAVGRGPGSYTGVRLAIALAQGWQLAREIKIIGIGTADCLAEQARLAGARGVINVVIDAQRGEFYLGDYELNASGRRIRGPLRLATRLEVQEKIDTGEAVIGPDLEPCFPAATPVHPSAMTIAELASEARTPVPGEALEPVYLREISFVKAAPPRVLAAG